MWEDPWIPTTPARPAQPIAPIRHLRMNVSDLINGESKEWDVRLLENYVSHDYISIIRSLVISPTNPLDTFCWNYKKNGQYMVKF